MMCDGDGCTEKAASKAAAQSDLNGTTLERHGIGITAPRLRFRPGRRPGDYRYWEASCDCLPEGRHLTIAARSRQRRDPYRRDLSFLLRPVPEGFCRQRERARSCRVLTVMTVMTVLNPDGLEVLKKGKSGPLGTEVH